MYATTTRTIKLVNHKIGLVIAVINKERHWPFSGNDLFR
jgi:hypothetical protein